MKTTGIIAFGFFAFCSHLLAEEAQPEIPVALLNIDIVGAPCDRPLTLVTPTTMTNAVRPFSVRVGVADGRIAVGSASYRMSEISFSSVKAAVTKFFGRPPDREPAINSVSWVTATDRGTEITVNVHYQSREITVGFGEHPVEKEEDT